MLGRALLTLLKLSRRLMGIREVPGILEVTCPVGQPRYAERRKRRARQAIGELSRAPGHKKLGLPARLSVCRWRGGFSSWIATKYFKRHNLVDQSDREQAEETGSKEEQGGWFIDVIETGSLARRLPRFPRFPLTFFRFPRFLPRPFRPRGPRIGGLGRSSWSLTRCQPPPMPLCELSHAGNGHAFSTFLALVQLPQRLDDATYMTVLSYLVPQQNQRLGKINLLTAACPPSPPPFNIRIHNAYSVHTILFLGRPPRTPRTFKPLPSYPLSLF